MARKGAIFITILLLLTLLPWNVTFAQPAQGDKLKIVYLAAQGTLFMGVFNPSPSGMTDVYTGRVWYFLHDPPYVMGPDGNYHSYRCELVSVVYNVRVPSTAVIWNDSLQNWTSPHAGELAKSAVTWRCGLGTFVDGQKITLADYLFAYAMDWEWSHWSGPYYDQSWNVSMNGKLQEVLGLKVDSTTPDYVEFTIYQNYAIPYSTWVTAVNYVPYPEIPWQLYYAVSELVSRGYSGKTFSWSEKPSNGYQLDLIDPEQSTYIANMLLELKNGKPIPTPLSRLGDVLRRWGVSYSQLGLENADYGYSTLIGWINAHGNALVTNGPYYVEKYDPKAMTVVLKAAGNKRIGYPDEINGKKLPWDPYWKEIEINGTMNSYTALLNLVEGRYDVYWTEQPYRSLSSIIQGRENAIELIKTTQAIWDIDINFAGDPQTGLVNSSGKEMFNPFALHEVRFAMNWLVNRQYIVSQVLQGSGAPIYGPHPTGQINANRTYSTVARAFGITPWGNETQAIQMITKAMQSASRALARMNHTLVMENGTWYFDGEPVTVKVIARVEDERLDEGKYIAQILQKAGFKVDLLQWTSSQAIRAVYGSDPKNLQWHVYTEGWLVNGIADVKSLAQDFQFYDSLSVLNWNSNYRNPVTIRELANSIAGGNLYALINKLDLRYYNTPDKLRPLLDWTGYDLANLLAFAKWTGPYKTITITNIPQFWDVYKLAYALHLYNSPRVYTVETWNFYPTSKRVRVEMPDPVSGIGSFLSARSIEPTGIYGGTGIETAPTRATTNGSIYVTSEPEGATIYIDGDYQGTTPINVTTSPGVHRVEVELSGYRTYSTTVMVNAGKSVVLNVTLEPKPGILSVNSTPPGAEVYVNGTYRGRTPLSITLPPGRYQVVVTLKGYQQYAETINLSAGENVSIFARLNKEAVGTLQINTTPSGADVYVDGSWRGTTPIILTLPPGTHTIEIRKEGYPPLTEPSKSLRGRGRT